MHVRRERGAAEGAVCCGPGGVGRQPSTCELILEQRQVRGNLAGGLFIGAAGPQRLHDTLYQPSETHAADGRTRSTRVSSEAAGTLARREGGTAGRREGGKERLEGWKDGRLKLTSERLTLRFAGTIRNFGFE